MTPLLALWLVLHAAPDAGVKAPGGDDAAKALAPFKRALKEALVDALAKSPEAAIEVCAKQAPELARAHSHDGVRLGRASDRLRNPANAPPAWVTPLLAKLASAPSGSEASATVALANGRTGTVEAIWVQPLCLTCHGKVLAPEVEARLKARYPADAARGYEVGDFRGVFWVER